MDTWDGFAAMIATFAVILIITLSRRMDRQGGFLVNALFFALTGAGFYGFFYKLDHPFWGDVIVSSAGAFAAIGLAFVADHLARSALRALRRIWRRPDRQ